MWLSGDITRDTVTAVHVDIWPLDTDWLFVWFVFDVFNVCLIYSHLSQLHIFATVGRHSLLLFIYAHICFLCLIHMCTLSISPIDRSLSLRVCVLISFLPRSRWYDAAWSVNTYFKLSGQQSRVLTFNPYEKDAHEGRWADAHWPIQITRSLS